MLALSIRQPWAELILRGIKTVEYRTRPTRIIGQRFYIYAAGKWPARSARPAVETARGIWSLDLAMPDQPPPQWMIELAERLILEKLPTGVIVGSAVISHCTPAPAAPGYRWHLGEVERIKTHRKPARHPQPAWFRPF